MYHSKACSLAAVIGINLLLASIIRAQVDPPNCAANASNLTLAANTGGPVQVGQVIEYQVVLINPQLGGSGLQNCRITNVHASLRLPNGQEFVVLTNVTLPPGQSIICPGHPLCLTNVFGPANFGYPYVARLTDLQLIDPQKCPPLPGTVPALAAHAFGAAVVLNGDIPGAKTYLACYNNIEVRTACISCTTFCTNALDPSGLIGFSGSIQNCANAVYIGLSASNRVGTATFPLMLSTNTIGPGQSATFSGTYTNPIPCVPITSVINVVGIDRDTGQVVTNTCSQTCSNLFGPCTSLTVTKACASAIGTNVGSSLTVTGQVCNTGTIAFTNVTVTDIQPGVPVNASTNLGTLEPGQCKAYSFSWTATTCAPNTDTVVVVGGSSAGNVTNTASTTCFLCCPGISVEAGVACVRPGGACPVDSADYRAIATGIAGNTESSAENPEFCYRLVVRNNGQDPLVNISVTDAVLGITNTFPGPLAVGGAITINVRTNWNVSTTNTTRVAAQCGGPHANGAAVSAQSSAITLILPAGLTCQALLTAAGDLDGDITGEDHHVTLPNDGALHLVTNALRVCNNGAVALTNLTITAPLLQRTGCTMPPILSLATGQCATVVLCVQQLTADAMLCSTKLTNSIVVTASGSATNELCTLDQSGSNVLIRTLCQSIVECQGAQGACVAGPGYWIHHPQAWPAANVIVGGVSYSKETAIAIMSRPDQNSKDKTSTLFRQVVAAKLNVLNGADSSCIQATIEAADRWLQTHAPSGVPANSSAWKEAEPLKAQLERYNEGKLCANKNC